MDAPEDFHDPLQCGKQRRQFLSADKLSVGFFLGAGCPTAVRITQDGKAGDEPLIPDIKGLTKTVREETSASQLCGKAFAQLLTVLKEAGEDTPTVEVMLTRIRALREDRKSVAEGKSVSVRVDIGCRRIIKKKNLL